MVHPFKDMDIVSTLDIGRGSLEHLFQETDSLQKQLKEKGVVDVCGGSLLVTVFLEPSTRTRLSFQIAMTRLGGQVIDFGLAEAASIVKGESFEDTMRMVDGYDPDAIVLRSRVAGSARSAADLCAAPVINAGDGSNEHPTQAMLDLYTIGRIRGSIDGVKIGLMGDLAHSRTTSSLSYALDKFNGVQIFYIAPAQLQVRQEVIDALHHARIEKVDSFESVVTELDFLYVTRLQRERFSDPTEYERLKGSYLLNRKMLLKHDKVPYILHPLPRVDELNPDMDDLPISKYFEQARNGVYVRAALLKNIFGR